MGPDRKRIRIVLAEDHHVARAAIASFLSREPDFEIVGEVADATELFATLEAARPDLLVLDAPMPGHRVIESARGLLAEAEGRYNRPLRLTP